MAAPKNKPEINYEDSGETGNCPWELAKNYGEHFEESVGVFGFPAE